MTAGNDGTPENDDPFAYLYRNEGGEQPDPAGGQPGVPRTSYHEVQRVGERRVPPGRGQTGGYGYPQPASAPQPDQQGGYGYPPQQQGYGYDQGQGQQQYGGGATQQYPQQPSYDTPQPPPGGRRSAAAQGPGGPNRKGLMIAAVAVVVVVAIGIAYAMTNSSGDNKQATDKPSGAVTSTTAPSSQTTPSASATPFDSQKVDASTLSLAGGAAPSTEHPGASAQGGTYVDSMATAGASVTWTVTVPKADKYTYFVSYGNAGADATLTLGINGKPRSGPVNFKNYGSATDWAKAWGMTTYAWVDLKKGANTLTLSCAPSEQCGVNLDQVWLKQGQVTK
jgi:hypothetical protein